MNKNEIKTLDEQMSVYSERREKIEQLKKELLVNPEWTIYYDEDNEKYRVRDFWNNDYPINVELREKLPNSYFHSPELDKDIIGYEYKTGGIIYDLWKVGKTEMLMSEGIYSDFHDTGYGIGGLLKYFEKEGYGNKVPPIHILQPSFINYQTRLQGSMENWGYDVDMVKPHISDIEQRKFDMREDINFYVKLLDGWKDIPEDSENIYTKILDDLRKEYDALG